MVAKVGRNDLCPCGSGLKYKRCCVDPLKRPAASESRRKTISLAEEIEIIQTAAEKGRKQMRELGVFVLFSTESGDGWLLEVTCQDALLLSSAGKAVGIEMEVTPETIAVNWSHRFAIRNKVFETTAYEDKKVVSYPDYPTASIAASVKRIKKRFAPEMLEGLHVDSGR
jgi:hypothetical protein